MKKLLFSLFFCLVLIISSYAANAEFGYYDVNHDGCVKTDDTLALLDTLLNSDEEQISVIRVVQCMKISTASTAVNATVIAVDNDSCTVTFSTTHTDNITLPFDVLGITDTVDADTLDSTPATLTLQNPVSNDSSVYAALIGSHTTVQSGTSNRPISIKALNTKSENGSHANDDFHTASVEISYRETVDLTSDVNHRYRLAFYPRVKKVKDDLYLLTYHIGELGSHVFYATSKDSLTWSEPQILYNNKEDYAMVPTYTSGPLIGNSEDRFAAVNPDACVLDNGEILLVFAIRPASGYRHYPDLSGLMLVRGTVNEDNSISWSEPKKITVGQVWEPFIWQRNDGQIEIYWSNPAPYMTKYGYDVNVRSAGVSMIYSNDNGYTWSPDIEEGKSNGYLFKRVYNELIGYSYGTGDDGNPFSQTLLPYFGGQMPAVTRLYNGLSLIGVEVRRLNQSYTFSYATSKANGDWDALSLTEDGPANSSTRQVFNAAGPYLATFPSGEVYLTYHWSSVHYYKMGAPDGSAFTDERYVAVPNASGLWGSSELVGSHEIISLGQMKKETGTDADGEKSYEYGIELTHSYLNHRINAQKFAISVDNNNSDWKNNTDAIFVGSESQAQLSVQVAHDKNNVYFLLSRIDSMLNTGDNASIKIAADNGAYYRIDIALTGAYTVTYCENGNETAVTKGSAAFKIHGTVNNNKYADTGVLTEFAIAKSDLKLENASSFKIMPSLINIDDGETITDTLSIADTVAYWPTVVLD